MEPTPSVILGKYKLGRLLGRGSFAKVYHAVSLDEKCPVSVAIKVINKQCTVKVGIEHRVLSEISAMRRLTSHPNILKIHEVLATKSRIYLVMDLAKGGDLFTHLARRKGGRMSETSACHYFGQLVSALMFCHARGVAHRDIKPHNLLLDEAGNILVSDFGLSALAESEKNKRTLHTACGTPAFTAPEVVLKGSGGYEGERADTWSCGVLLFVLLSGRLPFDDFNLPIMYKKILRREYHFPKDNSISKQAKHLIYHLLDPNPKARITIEALMNHPWMTNPRSLDGFSTTFHTEVKIKVEKCMNAFDIISMSSGLDLSGLFETCSLVREQRFTALMGKDEVEEKVLTVGRKLGYQVEEDKQGSVSLVKGRVRLGAEMFEVATHVVAVKVLTSGGIGLEECEWDSLRVEFEKLGLVWHNDLS